MFRLSREIRFAVNADPTAPRVPANGFGGVPAVQGLAHFFTAVVTLEGPLDDRSRYLRNIAEIDRVFRRDGLPIVESAVGGRFVFSDVLDGLFQTLKSAWPPAKLVELRLGLSPYQFYALRGEGVGMLRLSQRFEFSAAHRLHNATLGDEENRSIYGKCNNPAGHGHNYEVQVTIEGRPDANGNLIPVAELEQLVNRHAIDRLDHKHLNQEVPEFADLNPTVEQIAMVIYRLLKPALKRPAAGLASVTVWETPKTYCEYSE
jgi:6-pyruvoyltetrahydropterin/6-carboxytetrahydropterin synthase